MKDVQSIAIDNGQYVIRYRLLKFLYGLGVVRSKIWDYTYLSVNNAYKQHID